MVVGYEAGREGFWLLRALVAREIEAVVIDPVSRQVDRRAKRANTDRLDADALAVVRWRYARSEPEALRVVRVPGEKAENSREWQRERDRLSAERRGLADRTGKKLRTHGSRGLPGDWRAALRKIGCAAGGWSAAGAAVARCAGDELERLDLVECKLGEMRVRAETLDEMTCARIETLQRLRGIDATGARALSMLGFRRMFKNRRTEPARTTNRNRNTKPREPTNGKPAGPGLTSLYSWKGAMSAANRTDPAIGTRDGATRRAHCTLRNTSRHGAYWNTWLTASPLPTPFQRGSVPASTVLALQSQRTTCMLPQGRSPGATVWPRAFSCAISSSLKVPGSADSTSGRY